MREIFQMLEYQLARWRVQRRWRNLQPLLILVFLCVLCNLFGLVCGVAGYTLQRLGLLPTVTPTPFNLGIQ